MAAKAYATFHFIDGSHMTIEFDQRNHDNLAQLSAAVKQGIEQEAYSVEVEGSLLVIPRTSVKYLQITPTPKALPSQTTRNGRIIE